MVMFILLAGSVGAFDIPTVQLENAATKAMMPVIGLGTGGYGNNKKVPLGVYPECWSDGQPDPSGNVPAGTVDCSDAVLNATTTWLQLGGRRIDSGDSYNNCRVMGAAMKKSGVDRKDVFLVSKIGSGLPMGVQETDQQVAWMLKAYQTDYLDLVLIHWPTVGDNSSDPVCNAKSKTYDAAKCRIDTWRQLLTHWKAGRIRAVGVSNYNIAHLTEIKDAGLTLPAVNQCPYNPHLSSAQHTLVDFCKEHKITFNSYSPLGIPDWHKYPKSISTTGLLLEEPIVKSIASEHGISPAQLLLAWQWSKGIVFNPRSMNLAHMSENLDPKVYSTKITAAQLQSLDAFKQDACSLKAGADKNHWYECCGDSTVQPSIPSC